MSGGIDKDQEAAIRADERERWVIINGVGGYVCAAPAPGCPDGICGMPTESEPCPEHGGQP